MNVVSFGGGTNSTAMIIGMYLHKIPIDLILFADTGGEQPHGFSECMRVLKPDGILIFKWSEYNIPAKKVWKAIGQKPLFGHHSGKRSRTFWGCFMKLEAQDGGH